MNCSYTSIYGTKIHLPIIVSGLEVCDSFPPVTLDGCFIISPESGKEMDACHEN